MSTKTLHMSPEEPWLKGRLTRLYLLEYCVLLRTCDGRIYNLLKILTGPQSAFQFIYLFLDGDCSIYSSSLCPRSPMVALNNSEKSASVGTMK
jgi:hypothetical protein